MVPVRVTTSGDVSIAILRIASHVIVHVSDLGACPVSASLRVSSYTSRRGFRQKERVSEAAVTVYICRAASEAFSLF